MAVSRTPAGAYRTVYCDHLRAVGSVKSAPGAFATYDAVWEGWQNTGSRYSGRNCHCRRYRNLRIWLLGAGTASDYELVLCCFRSVARLPMEARISYL